MKPTTDSRIQLAVLGVLFVLVAGYQLKSSVDLYTRLSDASAHARYPFGISGRDLRVFTGREPGAEAAGVQRGDRILAVDGRPVRGLADLYEPIDPLKDGDTVRVTVQREDGSKADVMVELAGSGTDSMRRRPGAIMRNLQSKAPGRPPDPKSAPPKNAPPRFRPIPLSDGETQLIVLTGFLTVWFCIALGFFIAFRRPTDILAWEVLFLLLGFGQMAAGETGAAYGWGLAMSLPGTAYVNFMSLSWPAFLLWFGLDFPDPASPKRFLAWLRWPVTIGVLILSVPRSVGAAGALVDVALFAPLNGLAEIAAAAFFWVTSLAVGLFFANLGYKRGTMTDPDGRRRLRMLFAGSMVSLTPILFLIIAMRFAGSGSILQWPPWTWIPPLLMLSLFPVTLAYVIVVERAMDVGFIIRQGLQYALATKAIFVVQVLLTFGVIFWAGVAASEEDLRRPIRMQLFAVAISGVLLLRKAAEWARVWIDRKFFRERVEAERVLSDLGQQVRRIMDTQTLLRTVAERVSSALHVTNVELALSPMAATAEGIELELPLEAGGRSLGWLRLGRKLSEEPYSGSDRKLLETVATQTALALENHRLAGEVAREAAEREFIQRELEIAREVQERLLPHRKPEVPGLDYAGKCRPAQSVGGDYYEYFLHDGKWLCCAVGDVAGKGVPAALVMASLQSSLRGLVYGGIQHLSDLFGKMNELLCDATTRNRFATLFYCRIDPASGLFSYTSAGHNAALLVRSDGSREWLDVRGIGLGLSPTASYPVGAGRLEPGDVIVIYSDGFTEAFNSQGEVYGEMRLEQLVCASRSLPAHGILDALFADADSFVSGAPQHDDMTAIVMKRV